MSPRWSNEYFQKAQISDIKPAEELKQVSILSFCVCQNVGASKIKKDGFRIQNYLDNYGQYPGIKCIVKYQILHHDSKDRLHKAMRGETPLD